MISRRIRQALTCLPELFAPDAKPMSILYIGAHHKETALVPQLKAAGHRISLLEIVPNYAKRFMRGGMSEGIFDYVHIGDVRDYATVHAIGHHNVTIWWHGPEHVKRPRLIATIASLEHYTSKLILIACPWGDSKMFHTDAKCTEKASMRHLSKLYPEDFEAMDYVTDSYGVRDGSAHDVTSQFIAWKWVNHD